MLRNRRRLWVPLGGRLVSMVLKKVEAPWLPLLLCWFSLRQAQEILLIQTKRLSLMLLTRLGYLQETWFKNVRFCPSMSTLEVERRCPSPKGSRVLIARTQKCWIICLLTVRTSFRFRQNYSSSRQEKTEPMSVIVFFSCPKCDPKNQLAWLSFQGWYRMQQQKILTPSPRASSIRVCSCETLMRQPQRGEKSSLSISAWERKSEGGKPLSVAVQRKNPMSSLVREEEASLEERQQSIWRLSFSWSRAGSATVRSRMVVYSISSSFSSCQQQLRTMLWVKDTRLLLYFSAFRFLLSRNCFRLPFSLSVKSTARKAVFSFRLSLFLLSLLVRKGSLIGWQRDWRMVGSRVCLVWWNSFSKRMSSSREKLVSGVFRLISSLKSYFLLESMTFCQPSITFQILFLCRVEWCSWYSFLSTSSINNIQSYSTPK